jgi:hypothetical protein
MRVARLGSQELVDPSKFATALPGALVDVTFILRHHFIRGNNTNGGEDSNTFQAFVQQVNILKPPPPPVSSPFQDRRKGGALVIKQSPRKSSSKQGPSRSEQVTAVDAFGPQAATRAAEKRKRPDSEAVASSSKKPREVS